MSQHHPPAPRLIRVWGPEDAKTMADIAAQVPTLPAAYADVIHLDDYR